MKPAAQPRSTWRLVRRSRGARVLGCAVWGLLLLLGGPVVIMAAFVLPAGLFAWLGQGAGAAWAGLGFVAGLLAGLATAVAVALTFLRGLVRLWRWRMRWGTVTLGADGVRWSVWGPARYAAWDDITRVEIDSTGAVVLHGRERAPISLRVENPQDLLREIEIRRARWRALEAPPPLEELERRAGETAKRWRDRVRAVLEVGDYRARPIEVDELLERASHPKASGTQRIASALALSRAPTEALERVRIAVDDVADPELADELGEALHGKARRGRAMPVPDSSR